MSEVVKEIIDDIIDPVEDALKDGRAKLETLGGDNLARPALAAFIATVEAGIKAFRSGLGIADDIGGDTN